MGDGPDDLRQHRGFEDRAAHRSPSRVLRVLEPREMAQGPDVGEVHLRRFHEPLPDVREVGTHHGHLVGRFQNRQPRPDGIDRDAKVPSDVGQVEKLRAAGRQHPQQVPVLRQVSDLTQRAYVPFQVRLEIAGMPQVGVPFRLRCEFRVSTAQEPFPKAAERTHRGRTRDRRCFPPERALRASFGLAPGER